MSRPSILEAVERKHRIESIPDRASQPKAKTARAEGKAETRASAGSHAGKINVSAYFPPEVKASLRMVQAKRGGKVQDLLGEALNLLFAKYNVPEAAPMDEKAN